MKNKLVAVIETEKGTIRLRLFAERTSGRESRGGRP
jgi:hypothetical protein